MYGNESIDMTMTSAKTPNKIVTNGQNQIVAPSTATEPATMAAPPKSRKRSTATTKPRTKSKKSVLIENLQPSAELPLQLIKNEEPLELLHKMDHTTDDDNSAAIRPMATAQIIHLQSHEQIGGVGNATTIVVKDAQMDVQQQFISWPIVSYMSS